MGGGGRLGGSIAGGGGDPTPTQLGPWPSLDGSSICVCVCVCVLCGGGVPTLGEGCAWSFRLRKCLGPGRVWGPTWGLGTLLEDFGGVGVPETGMGVIFGPNGLRGGM